MKYELARPLIKSGDMLLWSKNAGWNSRNDIETHMVRISTESQWTHVGVAWADHGRTWVMEITTRGCAPRLLSSELPFWWIPAPQPLSDAALEKAFSRFGSLEYSRWQAIAGKLKLLDIGKDLKSQCAEYALEIWRVDGISPSLVATPYRCMVGAMETWPGATLTFVTPE